MFDVQIGWIFTTPTGLDHETRDWRSVGPRRPSEAIARVTWAGFCLIAS